VEWKKFFALVGASLIISVGINGFLIPHELLDGGMIGIGLILNYAYGIKAGLAILVLSLPIYVYALIKSRPLFYKSIHGLLLTSFLIDALSPLAHEIAVPLLQSAVIGGLLVGSGIGLMLRYETSTGGLDLLALFLSRKVKLNVGLLIFLVDLTVLLSGHFLIGISFVESAIVVCCVGCMTAWVTKEKHPHTTFLFRTKQ
jgi:uncharacterized membrane-anchored protein YitT (DUF2179 family)